MNRLFLFLALVLLRIGGYAQCTLPSSYKPRSEFRDNESFLRYNFEEHKGDYVGKTMGVLYDAYEKGIRFEVLSTIETTPWLEDDNKSYIEGVMINELPAYKILDGRKYVVLYVYIMAGKKKELEDEFWNTMPEDNFIETFVERTCRWIIRDIKVKASQLLISDN